MSPIPTPTLSLELLGGINLRGLDRDAADGLLAQPRLVALLSTGNRLAVALRVAGVPAATAYDWLSRGDPDGTDPRDEVYRDFRARIEADRTCGSGGFVW